MPGTGPTLAIASYTFVEASRNRLLWLVLGFVIATFTFTEFLGEVAVTESAEFQSGFAGAVLRAFAVFVVSLFVITTMVREFNDKSLELVLSLPIHRASYFVGKLLGFVWVAWLVALVCSLCVLLYAPWFQTLLWGLSLAMELTLMTAFAMLCLFTFNQVTTALSVAMAFYVVSRTIASIQLMASGPLVESTQLSQRLVELFVDCLAFLLPELHRFTASSWLIYADGDWAVLLPLLGQTLVYLLLLGGAALFDLYRKNL